MITDYHCNLNLDLSNYWSKSESIPMSSITNLTLTINQLDSKINSKVELDGTNITPEYRQKLRQALNITDSTGGGGTEVDRDFVLIYNTTKNN